MAKHKQSSKRPQPQHKSKQRSSQFDKRQRLNKPNPHRRKTIEAKVPLLGTLATTVWSMAFMLDGRIAFRLSIIMAGMMLADDRRSHPSRDRPLRRWRLGSLLLHRF